jgi:hypothetical protein
MLGSAPARAPACATLRRAAAAELARCASCTALLHRAELVVCRTADGTQQFHLRCAAAAAWAAELELPPMLRDFVAKSGMAGTAALTELELALIYEELGSDERRAKRHKPQR